MCTIINSIEFCFVLIFNTILAPKSIISYERKYLYIIQKLSPKYTIIPCLGKMESFIFGSIPNFQKLGEYNAYTEYKKIYGDTFVLWFGR